MPTMRKLMAIMCNTIIMISIITTTATSRNNPSIAIMVTILIWALFTTGVFVRTQYKEEDGKEGNQSTQITTLCRLNT